MLEQENWPTENKLEHLRKDGQVPYSRFSTCCVVTICILATSALLRDKWLDFLSQYKSLFLEDLSVLNKFSALLDPALQLLLVPIVIGFFGALLWGLFQTKFLFVFSKIALNLSRLNPFKSYNLFSALLRFALILICTPVICLIAFLASYWLLGSCLSLLNNNLAYTLLWPGKVSGAFLPFLLAALALIAFIAWLVARFCFMLRHRMTKEELRQEEAEES